MKHGKITTLNYADQALGDKYLQLPYGSTTDRPGNPEQGMLRYNVDAGGIENYSRGQWSTFLTTADFRIPGASFPEDENVTIASLAMLLRQFQRTIVGGFDIANSTGDIPDTTTRVNQTIVSPNSGIDELSWISEVTRGEVTGWLDESGKGQYFASGKATHGANAFNAFEVIIDPYKISGFDESDRHNYIFDYFANIYRYGYTAGSDYTHRGLTCSITPAWDLLDPWIDPSYGKFRVHVSLRGSGNGDGLAFVKWFVKLVRFRNFRLQSSPDLVPGGGSDPMPAVVHIEIANNFRNLNLQNYLLRKYPSWDTTTPVTVYIHVTSTGILYSETAASPALNVGGLPRGSKIFIKNEGDIAGAGGGGGSGGGYEYTGAALVEVDPGNGGDGGTAIFSDTAGADVFLDNTGGTIYAGGGGGGGARLRPVLGALHPGSGGGGGGCGGARSAITSKGGTGAGILTSNLNAPGVNILDISVNDLQGSPAQPSVLQTGGAIAPAGSSGGAGGSFLVDDLSAGGGGAGGDAGAFGLAGESIAGTPDILAFGWTSQQELCANDVITIGSNAVTVGNVANFDVNSSLNDSNWATTDLKAALNVGATNYKVEPFINKDLYKKNGIGIIEKYTLVYGFVVIADNNTVAGPTLGITGAAPVGSIVTTGTASQGKNPANLAGGSGGLAGYAIVGSSSITPATIDVVTPSHTAVGVFTGTIVGTVA